jgi:hypothetical protein
MTTLKARCSADKKASSSESATESLSDETSEFAVTFVRKLNFSPRLFGSGTPYHRRCIGITYSRSRADVRMHLPTRGPERACFFLTPWFLLVPR